MKTSALFDRRRRNVRSTLALAVATSVLALGAAAQAASPRETEAARLFYAGQYADALKIYVDLAVATGDPAYMCEIGRCYHRLGKPEEASRNLRDCLTQAKLPPKKKREFQVLQSEVEAARRTGGPPPGYTPPGGQPGYPPPGGAYPPPGQAPGAGYPPPGGAPPAGGPPPGGPPPGPPAYGAPQAGGYPPPGGQPGYPPPGGQPGYPPPGQPGAPPAGWGQQPGGPPPGPGPAPTGAPPPPAEQPADVSASAGQSSGGSGMKIAGYAAGGVGVLAALGGAGAGFMAKSKFDEVAKEYNENKHKNAKTYNTLQYVLYGVGAAGIATGIILLIMAPSSGDTASSGLHIVAAPDSIGIGGRF